MCVASKLLVEPRVSPNRCLTSLVATLFPTSWTKNATGRPVTCELVTVFGSTRTQLSNAAKYVVVARILMEKTLFTLYMDNAHIIVGKHISAQ